MIRFQEPNPKQKNRLNVSIHVSDMVRVHLPAVASRITSELIELLEPEE